jgi:hypothetical protein
MYYICVEDNLITSIINYEPAVPESVTITEISDTDFINITESKTHYFDVLDLTVKPHTEEVVNAAISKESQDKLNAEHRLVLQSTDWKVLRHLREKALGQTTSLTDEEYLELEQSRADAAAAIVEIQ